MKNLYYPREVESMIDSVVSASIQKYLRDVKTVDAENMISAINGILYLSDELKNEIKEEANEK